MTDNQKRAHDLAIAMLPSVSEARIQSQIKDSKPNQSGNVHVTMDYYKVYKEIYDGLLKSFEQDFPSI